MKGGINMSKKPAAVLEPIRTFQVAIPPDTTALMAVSDVTKGEQSLATISTVQEAQAAGIYLRGVRQAIREIKAKYAKIRKAILDPLKAEEDTDLAPYLRGELLVNKPLIAFQVADAARVERERRAQLEKARLDEEARRAAEVLEIKKLAATATGTEKRVLNAQAKAVEKSPLLPRVTDPLPEKTKIPGVSLTEKWTAQVNDEDKLIAAVLAGKVLRYAVQANQAWLNDQADALRGELNIPGVIAVQSHSQTARKL